MAPSTGRSPQPTPFVVACYVAYASVGWFLSGLGATLPALERDVGRAVAVYPLLPGVVLLAWGVAVVRRGRPQAAHTSVVAWGSHALGGGLVVMGITAVRAVSLGGAVVAALAAAALIRLLPGALATARPDDTERVFTRANGWSSLAGISAPLAVGGSIALGVGWFTGMFAPIAVAAIAVAALVRRSQLDDRLVDAHTVRAVVPPVRTWWREWAVLMLSIVVEFCFAYLAATYLHDEVGLSTAWAATGAAAWGAGMTAGRFALSATAVRTRMLPSLVLIASGFLLLWALPSWPVAVVAGIGIAGLGASPLYPSRMTALLHRFPSAPDAASARGSLASGAALLASPALMVSLRAITDVRSAYLAVPVLLVVLAVLTWPEHRQRATSVRVRPRITNVGVIGRRLDPGVRGTSRPGRRRHGPLPAGERGEIAHRGVVSPVGVGATRDGRPRAGSRRAAGGPLGRRRRRAGRRSAGRPRSTTAAH